MMNNSAQADERCLAAMFDPSAAKRMDAVRNSPRTDPASFALRAVVLFDRTVVVRV